MLSTDIDDRMDAGQGFRSKRGSLTMVVVRKTVRAFDLQEKRHRKSERLSKPFHKLRGGRKKPVLHLGQHSL